MLACACPAHAFDTSVYAENSRLNSGRWMKIRTDRDGMYLITLQSLRSWGFTDASKVRVYGYGGRRLPDQLNASTYLDDLTEVQSELTDRGIAFYGLGAGEWTGSGSSRYFVQNDFSDYGYYFVGVPDDDSEARVIETVVAGGDADGAETSFTDYVHHELERTRVSGEAGPLLLGEDFRYTRTQTIGISAPGSLGGRATLLCSFVSNLGGGGTLGFAVNGQQLDSQTSDRISSQSSNKYVHAMVTVTTHTFDAEPTASDMYNVAITLRPNTSCTSAHLNFLTIGYERELKLPSTGQLTFTTASGHFTVDGVTADTRVWDVTDAQNVHRLSAATDGTRQTFRVSNPRNRTYVAWDSRSALMTPVAAGYVSNQNLHSHRDYDMVIVAPSAYLDAARKLARLHEASDEQLKVSVVTPEEIYNEFSSGTPDIGGLRRYFKMLYDRGQAGDGRTLRYAILMARTTVDNRRLSAGSPNFPTIPSWMPREYRASVSDNEGYCSDDITAMLEDGSGASLSYDKLSIAIGRIPVTSVSEADDVVAKAVQYAEGAKKTAWKHRFLYLADDEDGGVHIQQTEQMIDNCIATEGQQQLVRKVYIDAYPFEGTNMPEARAAMFRYLDEGVVWWNFIGHANTTGWTHENQLSYNDLNNLYLRTWPFIYAATCDFLRIDGGEITGGEILYKERYGGAIGIISAVRPVFISLNGRLSLALGRALSQRDDSGRFLSPGEVYRRAKNDIRNERGEPTGDTNRLRYVFIGDPALHLAMPSNIVRLDSIGGQPVSPDNPGLFEALGQVPVSGTVTDAEGNTLEDFNGVAMIEIFDAERSKTTLGHVSEPDNAPANETFEEYGDRIYCGSTKVTAGRFSLTVAMPSELTQNYRPATMSLYAYSTEDDREAVGVSSDFYAYGYDTTVADDDTAPVIESFVLNHSDFSDGDAVNTSPMIIASIRDDVGLNVSNAGIGHQMTATLDGNKTYTDLSLYYTPAADGSPSGVINYPLSDLRPGNHTLVLRVWDTASNSATASLNFYVQENLAPKIYDVYTDANPASTSANFYLSHNQPDNMVTVSVTVYNLLGRPVWTGQSKGRSDMFLTVPVTWDLTDTAGRRVGRGIYLYRATITADGESYETASRKIAVTAQ